MEESDAVIIIGIVIGAGVVVLALGHFFNYLRERFRPRR